jgi:7-cyano-7-deazaguanine synthase
MTTTRRGALVALSGGQDSATCLYYALREYHPVRAISFDYDQRHKVELNAARRLAEGADVEHNIVPVPALRLFGGASLTDPSIASAGDASGTGANYAESRGLPSSFVPGRNAILLSTAAAFGLPRGLDVLVTGVCAEDRAGYPDCRDSFVRALERALQIGMDAASFQIDAPLLHRSKAETWALAAELDVLEVVRHDTHTCYEGDHDTLNEWGYGCGECPACEVRAEGWRNYVERYGDPTARLV